MCGHIPVTNWNSKIQIHELLLSIAIIFSMTTLEFWSLYYSAGVEQDRVGQIIELTTYYFLP